MSQATQTTVDTALFECTRLLIDYFLNILPLSNVRFTNADWYPPKHVKLKFLFVNVAHYYQMGETLWNLEN